MRQINNNMVTELTKSTRSVCRIAFVLFCVLAVPTASFAIAPLEVFVSIAPQRFLVERLGGHHVNTELLIGEGKSPHLFHPTTRQLVALSQANLFFSIDMEFEQILIAKISQTATSLTVINSVQGIEKTEISGHHGHGEYGGSDPHVWLSPPNLIQMAVTMTAAMGKADPVNADYYNTNLKNLTTEFEALDKKIQAELAPFAGKSFYVFHPSFGYFARRYNLHQEAVEVEGKSPTPRQLSALISKARKEKVKVIFVQDQFDPRSARTIASAIDGEVLPLNSLTENVMDNLKVMSATIRSGLSR